MANKSRRTFMISAISALPALVSLPLFARALSLSSLGSNNGEALKAYGDGKRDATSVIQDLIDNQPSSGGTVVIPAGKYLIDVDKGVVLRSGIHLSLLPGVSLIAMPTRLGSSSIIKIYRAHDVSVSGGSLVGERDKHLGRTGEWGFGIDVRASSSVTLSNIIVSKCWGDGFYLGSLPVNGKNQGCSNIVMQNVTATENRRQGLSIIACNGARIMNSKFLSTNGTSPAAGIDLEPNAGDVVENIVIQNCDVLNNAGSGIQTWNASSSVEIINCRINHNGGRGVYLGGRADGVSIHDNHVSGNGDADIYVGKNVESLKMSANVVTSSSLLVGLVKRGRIYYEPKK
ncbi:right-handed parallel beta-helix repeat-containing protein [Rhodanobacter glycinis]|uniref:Right-handed parallel beta-helix repeat-containing protein n=1 Tax=Rhodanobacter glycinis TaxID=582702 RepID=A0A5B9E6C7_9GAMM|nr:right-handed parallel beta-helix repeat-containing protein [Rhodanobacter glycinis]QEE25636.1 right-handed parallel beta-helix repeat-containing protein [Rhodanobacter glycinis]